MPPKAQPPKESHPLADCAARRDKVVVRRDQKPSQSAGGIHLPDSTYHKQQVGTVTSFGPEVEGLKVGDRVLFSAYAGTEVQQHRNAEEYAVLRDEDILAVLNANPEG